MFLLLLGFVSFKTIVHPELIGATQRTSSLPPAQVYLWASWLCFPAISVNGPEDNVGVVKFLVSVCTQGGGYEKLYKLHMSITKLPRWSNVSALFSQLSLKIDQALSQNPSYPVRIKIFHLEEQTLEELKSGLKELTSLKLTDVGNAAHHPFRSSTRVQMQLPCVLCNKFYAQSTVSEVITGDEVTVG